MQLMIQIFPHWNWINQNNEQVNWMENLTQKLFPVIRVFISMQEEHIAKKNLEEMSSI